MAFKWTGLNELKKALTEAIDMDEVKTIVRLNGAEMQANAMRNAPVKTGQLKRSVMLELENNGMTAEVSANTEYAPYVEWGTRYMDAQPYMKPAFEQQKVRFERDIDRLMKK